MHPKVLIVGTSPYSTSGTSRTFDAYFHFWEKDRVAQIFSRNWVPAKGHCAELYQITDAQLLKRWLHRAKDTGTVYYYDELEEQKGITETGDTASVSGLYKLGAKHSPSLELMRRALWRKKYWCTPKLNEWLDKFQPDCVFYSFSNHVFFQQVALYVADRYQIPIITGIGDDFYFNDKKSLSPAYRIFRRKFKKYTRAVLNRPGSSAVYCGDRIKDKYNGYFDLGGRTVYNTSTVTRREFRPVNTEKPLIVYFGSIRLGRSLALLELADALRSIDPGYRLEVYSSESDESYSKELSEHPNVDFRGAIPYAEVRQKIADCDIYVIAEGFRPQDINLTRYSLSTKAPDSLASGAAILTYGPGDAGVVDYMAQTGASTVCTDKSLLADEIRKLIFDTELQRRQYELAAAASAKNHKIESTTTAFESVIADAVKGNKEKNV